MDTQPSPTNVVIALLYHPTLFREELDKKRLKDAFNAIDRDPVLQKMIHLCPMDSPHARNWAKYNSSRTKVDQFPVYVVKLGNEQPTFFTLGDTGLVFNMAHHYHRLLIVGTTSNPPAPGTQPPSNPPAPGTQPPAGTQPPPIRPNPPTQPPVQTPVAQPAPTQPVPVQTSLVPIVVLASGDDGSNSVLDNIAPAGSPSPSTSTSTSSSTTSSSTESSSSCDRCRSIKCKCKIECDRCRSDKCSCKDRKHRDRKSGDVIETISFEKGEVVTVDSVEASRLKKLTDDLRAVM